MIVLDNADSTIGLERILEQFSIEHHVCVHGCLRSIFFFGIEIVKDLRNSYFIYEKVAYLRPRIKVYIEDDGKYHLKMQGYHAGDNVTLFDEVFTPNFMRKPFCRK